MADFFQDGQRDYIQRLNQLYTAFAAGPYGSLPSTGGTLTGPLTIDTGSATAVLKLAAGAGSSTGPVIVGYRNNVFCYAMGTESIVRGGTSSDLAFDALGNELKFYAGGGGGFNYAMAIDADKISAARNIIPRADNAHSLGSAGLAYSVVYARTGAINPSDARLKCYFRDLSDAEISVARELARAIGIYRWRDAVEEKGLGAREHIGPTVQRAIEIMQSHGLDPFNYGFICHDEWDEQTVEHPAIDAVPASAGRPAIEARAAHTEIVLAAGDRYAFRYDELAMFIAAGQEAATAAIEARLAALEAAP